MFSLNPQSGIPLYRQLVDQVKLLVAGGQLKAGAPLPSVRELADKHAVNPMTISKAYSLLEAEGVLLRQRGKPMTVAAHNRQGPEAQILLAPLIHQLIQSARQLALGDDDIIQAVRQGLEQHHD
ncbi:GntR family transcriptional regulator [Gallaecimonas kandeliae]|uniref:GntR family transcriptional regulator n=1 Tax=Gallaecimonas kandeliae TaxID=3029055 RepID=UPI00264737E0|nr:GntR family transcriptional regulator [Gallaecimonas kandeliae]WKE66402.1 GntR family transcriptional regulator [Gallaecimonas kandeliae]